GDPWTSDGREVAFSFIAAREVMGYVETFELASQKVSTLQAFPKDRLFEIKWLPDGKFLLTVFAEKGANAERSQIGLLSSTGELRPITRDINRYATLSVSADGKSASSVQVKTNRTLTVIDETNPQKPSEGRAVPQLGDARQVDWTPDGKLVVVDGAGITRVDPNGSIAAVLLSDPEASIVSMSVCGSNYLLLSWPGHGSNAGNVWRANLDGSAPRKLTSGVFDYGATCSPDGKWLYYIEFPNTSRLMRIPSDGGKPEPVAGATVANQLGIEGIAAIAPAGK